jgi:hypothetical protein
MTAKSKHDDFDRDGNFKISDLLKDNNLVFGDHRDDDGNHDDHGDHDCNHDDHGDHDGHVGASLFTENFDGLATNAANPQFAVVDLSAHGWTGAAHTELGANGYGGIATTSGTATSAYWLDTQNSPGGIDISHTFTSDKSHVELSFDIGTQSLDYQGNHYATDPNAKFDFKIDGKVVAELTAAQVDAAAHGPDHMAHFEVAANVGVGAHTLELVDATANPGYAGFAVDSIHIHDLIV